MHWLIEYKRGCEVFFWLNKRENEERRKKKKKERIQVKWHWAEETSFPERGTRKEKQGQKGLFLSATHHFFYPLSFSYEVEEWKLHLSFNLVPMILLSSWKFSIDNQYTPWFGLMEIMELSCQSQSCLINYQIYTEKQPSK